MLDAINRSWVAHAVDWAATRSSPSRRLTGSQCVAMSAPTNPAQSANSRASVTGAAHPR